MTTSGILFKIEKSFGHLHLIPRPTGLELNYLPVTDGEPSGTASGATTVAIPLQGIGGLWATARAFLYGVESLDENIILRFMKDGEEINVLVKLYRDKPRGQNGRLRGDEVCWLRIVTGRSEEERRRIKLGPRDLLCIELACNSVLQYSSIAGHGVKDAQPIQPMINSPAAAAAAAAN